MRLSRTWRRGEILPGPRPKHEAVPPCGLHDCDDAAAHEHLYRYFFALPEAPHLPDGLVVPQTYISGIEPVTGALQADVAVVRLHSFSLSNDPTIESWWHHMEDVVARAGIGKRSRRGTKNPMGGVESAVAIADVITGAKSWLEPADDWNGDPRDLEPRQDSFMRALHAARTMVRAANVAVGGHVAVLPTYERIFPFVLSGVATLRSDDLRPIDPELLDGLSWEMGPILILEHMNFPGRVPEEAPPEAFGQWLNDLGALTPGVTAREHLINAGHLLNMEGEYATAVTSAFTAVEVLSTAVLSAIHWDLAYDQTQEPAVKDVAAILAGNTPVKAAQKHLPPLVGGNWTSPTSNWTLFRTEAAALRNRIVHGGYEPRRFEAATAVQQAFDAQSFLIERLALSAAKFPRAALLIVSGDGLEERGLVVGKVARFVSNKASKEPNYREAFGFWHRAVVAQLSL